MGQRGRTSGRKGLLSPNRGGPRRVYRGLQRYIDNEGDETRHRAFGVAPLKDMTDRQGALGDRSGSWDLVECSTIGHVMENNSYRPPLFNERWTWIRRNSRRLLVGFIKGLDDVASGSLVSSYNITRGNEWGVGAEVAERRTVRWDGWTARIQSEQSVPPDSGGDHEVSDDAIEEVLSVYGRRTPS
ncbi:unnamed protein product [Dovyalis caffra]|uniref:Uncharacterized protein n=1 Tax=Dovyalis caffra TaxID=77055 RepID=A0AAV1SRC2_9ROSI|nr:unnamed protein product [Dovyalis caffra]